MTETSEASPAESGDFSESIAIVYPANWPERDGAHVTLMYLGEIPDVTFTQADVQGALDSLGLSDYRNVDGNAMQFMVMVKQFALFGPNKNIPVMTVEGPTLDPVYSLVRAALRDRGIESASAYNEYQPHVTIKPYEIFESPSTILLDPPVLWWGLNK